MLRGMLWGLALCGLAHAGPPPQLDVAATAAWKGWTRPGRSTEVDLRLSADKALQATLEIVSGTQSVHARVELRPGRPLRLHVPIASAERITVSTMGPPATAWRRELSLAPSESPLLAVGLLAPDSIQLAGFHALALSADDLPRNASAYASIDALVLDAPTLAALDTAQVAALLVHAGACGRIVTVDVGHRLRRTLDDASGCAGRMLVHGDSAQDALAGLQASLASAAPPALTLGSVGALLRPDPALWQHVATGLAAYFAAAALLLLLGAALPLILLAPALVAALVWSALHFAAPPSRLLIWSEAEAGAKVARYQAWQQLQGVARTRVRLDLAPQLAPFVRPCTPARPLRLHFDSQQGRVASAEFDTRLFDTMALCFAGSFPMARNAAIEPRQDGRLEIENTGAMAWPAGSLLAAGRVHDLPPLAPGASATLVMQAGKPPRGAVERHALQRSPLGGAAALWPLDLAGVAEIPSESTGWMLLGVPPR